MNDFIPHFLAESDYADSTKESYRYALARLEVWLTRRGWTLDDLTVERYHSFLNGHGWSSNMRRMYAAAIRAFLRWLGYHHHPVLKLKLPKDNAKPGRVLEMNDVRDLLAVFDTSTPVGWRNVAMIALMVETGLRVSEVCRLKISDLDLRRRQFVVLIKKQKWDEGKFSEQVAVYLSTWLQLRPRIAKKGCPYVFVSYLGKRPGTQMTPGGLRKMFRLFGARSEIGRLSPHDLRRTMATLLTELGAPSRLVQKLGRWDDIRMVERYSQRLKAGQIDRYSPIVSLMAWLDNGLR